MLFVIYKFKRKYYGFRFNTEIQNHCENFMAWYFPIVKYWMVSEDTFKKNELNCSINKKYPFHYMIGDKILFFNDVKIGKNGREFLLT